METAWYETRSFMLGQYYQAENDKHYGSIFRNEMEFHMFTRTRNGFCDKCDLSPTERTDKEGYKLPGRMFHSKAKKFKDFYFKNWQSDVLFTTEMPSAVSCRIFKLDEKGTFLEELLTPQDCFRLLIGTLNETEEFRDFLTCADAKVGLKIHLQNRVETMLEMYPDNFQMYFGDPEWGVMPTHVVNQIGYGYVMLVRFDCKYENVDKLISHLQIFAQCILGTRDLNFLDGIPPYKIWIGPGCYENTCTVMSPYVQTLKSAYADISNYIKCLMLENNGKGFSIWRNFMALNKYERFGIDLGQNDSIIRFNRIPEDYFYFKVSTVKDLNPFALCKGILQLSKDLRQCRTTGSRPLQMGFEASLKDFRKTLISAIYLNDTGKTDVDTVTKIIQDYEYSEFSPCQIRQDLREVIKRDEDVEIDKHELISLLYSKGAKILTRWGISGEYVFIKFGNFRKSRTLKYWQENIDFFQALITTEERIPERRRKYFVNDLNSTQAEVGIVHYNEDKAVTYDMLGEYRLRNTGTKLCGIVKYSSVPKSTDMEFPNDLFGFPCVSSKMGGCSYAYRNWTCSVCNVCLRYLDEQISVLCDCGITPLQDCSFKCFEPNHGILPHYQPMDYEPYPPRSEINLLLIGESGVGKSTLINSLVNYQEFNNFQESFNRRKFVYMVPIQQIDNYKMETVRHSKTIPSWYIFPLTGSKVLRIIDTPGYTSKSSSDHVTPFLASVLNYARKFSMIHAVCFVIKATDKVLSDRLRALYETLLMLFLTRCNVIFVFTHCDENNHVTSVTSKLSEICTQSGLYDREPIEANTFRMNNKAFPYLAKNMRNITNENPDFGSFERSWEAAFREFKRMFKYADEQKPFKTGTNLRHEEKYFIREDPITEQKKTFQA